jgi:hypothetical protein
VKGLRLRQIDTSPPGSSCPERKVNLLKIHKESLVKSPQSLKYTSPNEKKSSHDVINPAGFIVIPIKHLDACTTKFTPFVHAERTGHKSAKAWKSCASLSHHACSIDQLNATDADIFRFLHESKRNF